MLIEISLLFRIGSRFRFGRLFSRALLSRENFEMEPIESNYVRKFERKEKSWERKREKEEEQKGVRKDQKEE